MERTKPIECGKKYLTKLLKSYVISFVTLEYSTNNCNNKIFLFFFFINLRLFISKEERGRGGMGSFFSLVKVWSQ